MLKNEEQQEVEREHVLAIIDGMNNLTDSLFDLVHFFQLEQRGNEHIATVVRRISEKFLSTEESWQKLPLHTLRSLVPCYLRSENDAFLETAGPFLFEALKRMQIFDQPYLMSKSTQFATEVRRAGELIGKHSPNNPERFMQFVEVNSHLHSRKFSPEGRSSILRYTKIYMQMLDFTDFFSFEKAGFNASKERVLQLQKII